jgi:HK97 family phage portal protein
VVPEQQSCQLPARGSLDGSPTEETHPLEKLLERRPNGYQNPTTFWRTLFLHAIHAGNGYGRIERTGAKPAAMHNLPPEDVWPFRYDAGKGAGVEQWYLFRPTKDVYPASDIIHLAGVGWDGMCGLDPVWLHSGTFQRAATLDRYTTRYLQRGTVIRGAIQIPQGVSEEQVEQVVATIRTYFSGADAERDVIVLSEGATLNNATLSPQESQLVQQGVYNVKQIAQITGVPPQFLFEMSDVKYVNTVEQAGLDLVRYTFRPWMDQVEDELTAKLLTPAEQDQGYEVKLDPAALMRGDAKTTTDTAVAQVNAGLRTRNEGRAMLSLPADKDPDSDKLKTLGDTAPKPAAAPATPPENPPADSSDKGDSGEN